MVTRDQGTSGGTRRQARDLFVLTDSKKKTWDPIQPNVLWLPKHSCPSAFSFDTERHRREETLRAPRKLISARFPSTRGAGRRSRVKRQRQRQTKPRETHTWNNISKTVSSRVSTYTNGTCVRETSAGRKRVLAAESCSSETKLGKLASLPWNVIIACLCM